jgi:hypothetical protein
MRNSWNKLKQRWGINNDFQVVIILLVFSLAGPTTLYFHRKIDLLLGITDDASFWLKLLVFIIIVLPVYNFFLFVYGTALGQYRFFVQFFQGKLKLFKRLGSFFVR